MQQLGQFVIHHWALCLTVVSILVLIFINEWVSQKNNAKQLSAAAAVDLINHEDALVIDIRDQELFRAGHILDAIRASADDFNQQRMDKYKKKPLILVCSKGIQAAALATKLREQGFEQPFVLAGGLAAWQEASLPLVKGK